LVKYASLLNTRDISALGVTVSRNRAMQIDVYLLIYDHVCHINRKTWYTLHSEPSATFIRFNVTYDSK